MVDDYCTINQNHKCIKYLDYEITRYALEEAECLCHENWLEIQSKTEYIEKLQLLLAEHGIPYPAE